MTARLIVGLVLVGALLAGCASLGAPASGEAGIAVTGVGRVAMRPDTALVDVGVEARAAQLADATAEVSRRMREVLARVKAAGVRDADIQTIVYAIDPVAEPQRPPEAASPRIVGYRVSNVARVRTRDVDGLGRIVDGAVAGGANVVSHIQFAIDDRARAEARARTLAMQDAAGKAGQLATAGGVRLGRLLSVREGAIRPPFERGVALASSLGPIEAGQLDVTISVDVRYAIEP
jgi:uncharacterized protein YggE